MKKSTFTSFTLTEGSDYGIPHLEDLDVDTFIKAISNLKNLTAVQKLDGANLRAGVDGEGKLYASREQKGGKRFYAEKDFPKSSAYDGFKTAFAVLKKNEELVTSVLSPGEAVNLEVIYGAQPNTVFYGKDQLNYLAVLELVQGDDPSIHPDQSKVKQLVRAFNEKTTTVETMVYDTADGRVLARAPKVTDWKVVSSDSATGFDKLDFAEEVDKLKKFLRTRNAKAERRGKDLTNFEVLKDRSQDLAAERQALKDEIFKNYKLPVKKKMLELAKKQKPSLRGQVNDEGAYHGIEGVIFTDPESRSKFKIVDRDVFTKINQFNYQVRKGVASRVMTTNADHQLEKRGGIVGAARARSIKLFGLENADNPNQARRVIDKLKGSDREATLKNLTSTLHQLNFESVKRKIQAIYVSALDDLDEALETFKKNADSYSLKLDDGTTIKYTKEIKRRTLLTFAEAHKTLREMLVLIQRAADLGQLIEIFFQRQLDGAHEE